MRCAFCSWLCTCVVALAAEQEPEKPRSDNDDSKTEAMREYMDGVVRGYSVCEVDESDTETELALHKGNLLRWTNPVSGVKPGGLYLWTRDGRPAAIVKMFFVGGWWYQNWHSLSQAKVVVEQEDGVTVWRPQKRGIEMMKVPEAPSPGKSPTVRLAQMREILEDVVVNDKFERRSNWVLRQFPKPICRYGASESEVLDGAILAFVQGTNPEGIAVLEARPVEQKKGEYEWYFAFAALTSYSMRATYQDKPVWSCKLRYTIHTKPEDTFFARRFRPPTAERR